jgi:hypothetical protein
MVLDGFPAEGLPNLKRKPIILSSDGEVADAASLIQDVRRTRQLQSREW